MSIFLEKLKEKRKSFFIALLFCDIKYREQIACLFCLYDDLSSLKYRITEPLAIQMRLCWWRDMFNSSKIPENAPPELSLLHGLPLEKLIDAIEIENTGDIPEHHVSSLYILYELIGYVIYNHFDYSKTLHIYAEYHRQIEHGQGHIDCDLFKISLPFKLRFIRIPLILQIYQRPITRFIKMIKNFMS